MEGDPHEFYDLEQDIRSAFTDSVSACAFDISKVCPSGGPTIKTAEDGTLYWTTTNVDAINACVAEKIEAIQLKETFHGRQ